MYNGMLPLQALRELYTFARIGNKYIGHVSCYLRLKLWDLIWHSNMIAVSRESGRLSVISVDESCRHLLDDGMQCKLRRFGSRSFALENYPT